MSKKNKVVNVPVETTEQLVSRAMDNISADIVDLQAKKDTALGAFRATASSLASVNEKLDAKIKTMDDLVNLVSSEKETAQKMMADNEAVRKKILDIIGE